MSSQERGAYLVAERIRKRWMEEVFELQGSQVSFSVSIGIAIMLDETESMEDIMERADVGLYTAKRSGRNCVIVHNGDTHTSKQGKN